MHHKTGPIIPGARAVNETESAEAAFVIRAYDAELGRFRPLDGDAPPVATPRARFQAL